MKGSLLIFVLSVFVFNVNAQMVVEESDIIGSWEWKEIERKGTVVLAEEVFNGKVTTLFMEDGTYIESKADENGSGQLQDTGKWKLEQKETEWFLNLSPNDTLWRPATIRTYEIGRMRLEFHGPNGRAYVVMVKMKEED